MFSLNLKTEQHSLLWIKDWISEHTGIQFPDHKLSVLEQRLLGLCHRLELQSIDHLIQTLKHSDEGTLLPHLIDAATTNHTHFYREIGNIQYFIEHIVPQYPINTPIRIWSAAASSGEEIYTLLMMLAEQHALVDIKRRFAFLATDVSPKVIAQAELGQYNQQRVAELPAHIHAKWFKSIQPDLWQISNELIDLCLFRRFNLLSHTWPFQQTFHSIFLRNVLYYFDQEIQTKILNRLYEQTASGGWLITSVTESIGELDIKWRRVRSGIYQK